ncbi:MAG: glycosyltransferase family 2 protein [Chloroflexi bacterium]|nr:MAG: glycosyltransferase family 2 protein [Chloroflexota bacterium]
MRETNGLIASVIVVGYNDKQYLDACMSSLLDQDMSLDSYEIIYADNASPDGSADYVAGQFPQVRVVRFDKNYGFAEGNNRAAEHAHGKYIAFQNADTVAHQRWLPELLKAIESDPLVKACHPSGVPLNFGGYNERIKPIERGVMCELTRYGYVDFTEKQLNGDRVPTLFIAGGSLLIDSAIFDQLKYYFDPTYFIYNEDTDLGLRINNLGYKILYVSSAPCYHQRAPSRRTSMNKKTFRMAYLVTRNRFITFYKNMHTVEFILTLPLIFMGSIVKLRTLPMGWMKKTIYALGLIPFTLYALIMAVIRFPNYSQDRAYILKNSQRDEFWLLRELWQRSIPPRTPLADGIAVVSVG